MTIRYLLYAGLPDHFQHEVAIYDSVAECIVDVGKALDAGLIVSCEPAMVADGDVEFDGTDEDFLSRYAKAVIGSSFIAPADREWLIRRGLAEEVKP